MALRKEVKDNIVKDFGIATNDTGSVEVQVAMLTENIRQLTQHCQQHPKDVSTKRGLLKMVCKRRSFLKYIEKKDATAYKNIIGRLGLKK